ncbi:cupin domain-containing protein [Pararhizobium mangrovi]|uniref:Cupin domain-containing protein n=1 Tax=Pararhizobium mangrovi TaxID=2590452 RepID=A0A506U5U2_9HYPH|nr:cupin domain-containing protein [Pararhizobium mangrovi]TPW27307.1 cupin domain-containing protein [Pararhizobium mangrovi]
MEAGARAIVERLGLRSHPEGGWFAETFRDGAAGERGRSTAIYYLLQAGERSHWHRVHDAAEVWHWYAGAALDLRLSPNGVECEARRLGNDLSAGERPQVVVPASWWQSAASSGPWTLAGCTVAPGFVFESFEMAPADWEPGGGNATE